MVEAGAEAPRPHARRDRDDDREERAAHGHGRPASPWFEGHAHACAQRRRQSRGGARSCDHRRPAFVPGCETRPGGGGRAPDRPGRHGHDQGHRGRCAEDQDPRIHRHARVKLGHPGRPDGGEGGGEHRKGRPGPGRDEADRARPDHAQRPQLAAGHPQGAERGVLGSFDECLAGEELTHDSQGDQP